MNDLIQRLFVSKKLIYAAIPTIGNVVVAFLGYDPTAKAMLVMDGFFAILLVIQGFLDLKFGSESDGSTFSVAVGPAVPDTVVTQNAPTTTGEGASTNITP